ncbi:transmembrane protein 248 [Callorhinchus milii]|uniref:TMEM248/TMEM219 domain-containing protein n=1 Tax=Callorhinchus milii TaxID=7868 RepID=V9KZ39_CALMI|nr:transmembrane protein 248 [Callorhinchus milii]
MVKWHLVENVKHWAYRRPPVVVFVLSISSLAIAFLSLGIYIQSHKVASVEDTQARNIFLKSLSEQEFCTSENIALRVTDTERLRDAEGNGGATRRRPDLDALSRPTENQRPGTVTLSSGTPVSVSLLVPMAFGIAKGVSGDRTYLQAVANGSRFGLTDSEAKEMINISLVLPWRPGPYPSQVNSSATKTSLTCVTMTAAAHVLPQARKYFPPCKLENFTDVTAPHPKSRSVEGSMKTSPTVQCYKAQYTVDPAFFVWLSEEERALSGRHLLSTSYALFLLAMIIFCLSAVCGLSRKTSPKALNLHKVQLLDL